MDQVRSSFDHQPIDLLINNAGLVNCKRLEETTPDRIRKLFEVNTLGAFWTIKAVLPEMKERNRGHIINVASIAGLIGNAFLTDYWYEFSCTCLTA
jgi:NADP-dependent 3-hydroxy acid dehydrogenase YdfG